MIQDIAANIAEGIWAPRASMRRMLPQISGVDSIVGLVVLGYVVQALVALVIPGARPETPANPLGWHIAGLAFQGVLFALSAGLVFLIGRIFGGTGSVLQTFAAMAWYSFVSAFLSPLALAGVGGLTQTEEPNGFAALLLVAATILGLRMFAGFVAEVHGFRNTWTVVAVSVGLVMGASALLSVFVQAG